jgi:hypothetical protein
MPMQNLGGSANHHKNLKNPQPKPAKPALVRIDRPFFTVQQPEY